jgi:hypothetical protein
MCRTASRAIAAPTAAASSTAERKSGMTDPPRHSLLLVDDDEELCAMLVEYLGPDGYSVTIVHDGATALETLYFDVVRYRDAAAAERDRRSARTAQEFDAARPDADRARRGGRRYCEPGPGLPESEIRRIFEPFHWVAEARERHSCGEGVGLAITARVAKAHGVRTEAHNREDGGLRIRLTLPLKV